MGWSRGTDIMMSVIDALNIHVPAHGQRVRVYKEIIPAFQDADWDNEMECVGEDKAFDEALRELDPDYFEDEEPVDAY